MNIHHPSLHRLLRAGLCLSLFGLLTTASRANLLMVDFQSSDTGGGVAVTETGFMPFATNTTTATASKTFSSTAGNITLEATSLRGSYNRNGISDSGALTYAALYNDYFDDATGNSITLKLSGPGVSANTDYSLRFYSFDNHVPTGFTAGDSIDMVYTPTVGTVGSALTVTYLVGQAPGSNDAYSAADIFTSNSSGELTFNIASTTASYGRAYINGLVVSAVVPEPQSAILFLMGTFLLLRLRRSGLIATAYKYHEAPVGAGGDRTSPCRRGR